MKARMFFVLCLLPSISHATPVYLDCMMTNGIKPVLWNISLDEALGVVSYTVPEMTGAHKYPAVFTADNVLFNGMEISRTSLRFKRTVNILGNVRVDYGQCKVVPKSLERKF